MGLGYRIDCLQEGYLGYGIDIVSQQSQLVSEGCVQKEYDDSNREDESSTA
jgi:hypothetical protein